MPPWPSSTRSRSRSSPTMSATPMSARHVRGVGIRQCRARRRHRDFRRDAARRQSRLRPAAALAGSARTAAHAAVRHRHRRARSSSATAATSALDLGEVEEIAITHGHWDHMGALPAAIDAIVGAARPRRGDGARQSRHVQRARRAAEERRHLSRPPRCRRRPQMEARGAKVVNDGRRTAAARRAFLLQRRDSRGSAPSRPAGVDHLCRRDNDEEWRPDPYPDGRAHAGGQRARSRPDRVQRLLAMPASSMSAPRCGGCFPTSRSMR